MNRNRVSSTSFRTQITSCTYSTAKNRVLQQVKIKENTCLINIRLQNKLQFYKTVSLSYTILHKKSSYVFTVFINLSLHTGLSLEPEDVASRSCTQPLSVHRSRMRRRIELGCVCPVCRCIRFILNSTSVVSRPPVTKGVCIYIMWTLRVHLSAIKSWVQSVLVLSVPCPVRESGLSGIFYSYLSCVCWIRFCECFVSTYYYRKLLFSVRGKPYPLWIWVLFIGTLLCCKYIFKRRLSEWLVIAFENECFGLVYIYFLKYSLANFAGKMLLSGWFPRKNPDFGLTSNVH